jgi:heptaprenyl diphosphate synthase
MFISAALVLHVVEGMLPVPFAVPGIKLGLANIVTLIAIMFFGFRDVLLIVILRCLMGSLFGGSISAFLFSVTGGMLSAIVMWLFYEKLGKYFSITGISTVGAIFHNVGQLLMASIIIEDVRIYGYLPVLMVSSVITGLFIGLVCNYAKKLIVNNVDKLGLNFHDK